MRDAELMAWIADAFGVHLVVLTELGEGGDDLARLWRGATVTGERYAVKLTGGGTDAGLRLTHRLARHGVPGVAAPPHARDGRPWSERAGRRLSLVPWVSDRRALGSDMTTAHWAAFGSALAAVHAAPAAPTDGLPSEDHRHDHVRPLAERLHRAMGSPGDAIARAFVEEWRDLGGGRAVEDLRTSADRLGTVLRSREHPMVVCHGDAHIGNLLLDDDDRVWIVDWDDAVVAPPERDLLFVLDGGVLAFAPVSGDEADAFASGYGSVAVDRDRLTYYRCVRALEDLLDPARWALDPARGEVERGRAREIVRGVLSPSGLVAQARGT